MINPPLTEEDAKKFRYGAWAGKPDGVPYNTERCALQVYERGMGSIHYQCGSKKGYGPNGLYCSRHGKEVTAMCKDSPMETWYKITMHGSEVVPVEVSSYTDRSVTLKGGVTYQIGTSFYKTKEEASTVLKRRLNKEIEYLQKSISLKLKAIEAINQSL